MIFDTTYTDKEVTLAINELVGKPFSLLKRLQLGGIGSHRIVIDQVNDELTEYINPGHSLNHVNIELRPNGILVHLKRRTQTYSWAIPFSMLQWSENKAYLSDGTHTIKLKNPFAYNESFFKRFSSLR